MDNISKARKGNKKAIKQVIKDNIEQMYKLVFLHTKYEDDAKRILTDTMYFIEGNMSKLDENQNIILWLYKITIINTNNFLKYVGMLDKDKSLDKYYCDGSVVSIDDINYIVLSDSEKEITLMKQNSIDIKLNHCTDSISEYCYYDKENIKRK